MRRTALSVAAAMIRPVVLLRRWFPVRVSGPSMEPTLRAGDLLAVRPLQLDEPRIGQIVVARAHGLEIVKRVAATDGGQVSLRGDNPAWSTDAVVSRDAIAGVVRACYFPPRRARLL